MMAILYVSAKCSDMCFVQYEEGGVSVDYDGYVPQHLGIGGGDYVELEIDVETGRVIGWDAEAFKAGIKKLVGGE
jgi:hypothetical protein